MRRVVEKSKSTENLACRRSGEKKKTKMPNHKPSSLIAAESLGSSMKGKFWRVGWINIDSKSGRYILSLYRLKVFWNGGTLRKIQPRFFGRTKGV